MNMERQAYLKKHGPKVLRNMLDDIRDQHPEWLEPIYIFMPNVGKWDAELLGEDTPESWAERVSFPTEEASYMFDIDQMPINTLKVLIQRGLLLDQDVILDILGRPPSVVRDQAYYGAMQGLPEKHILENKVRLDHDEESRIRLARIKDMFFSGPQDHKYTYVNPSTLLIDDIYEVHPIYIIPVGSGDNVYGLHVLEILESVNGDLSRPLTNPWTREPISEEIRDMIRKRIQKIEDDGYPLVPMSKEDYTDRTYGITSIDPDRRLDDIIRKNGWYNYPQTINILKSLNPQLLFAAKNMPALIPTIESYRHGNQPMPSIHEMVFDFYPQMASYVWYHRDD